MSESEKKQWLDKIDLALDDIRPHLAVDGGNIEVMDITNKWVVEVKWLGNCEMCSMSAMTMKAGVEQTLKSKFPEISGVTTLNGLVY